MTTMKYNYEDIAIKLMVDMKLDNGMGADLSADEKKYWVKKVARAAMGFFGANKEVDPNDPETISDLTSGDESVWEMYKDMFGWSDLNDVLNEYFEDGMDDTSISLI